MQNVTVVGVVLILYTSNRIIRNRIIERRTKDIFLVLSILNFFLRTKFPQYYTSSNTFCNKDFSQ